jgi:hypothetical protein
MYSTLLHYRKSIKIRRPETDEFTIVADELVVNLSVY